MISSLLVFAEPNVSRVRYRSERPCSDHEQAGNTRRFVGPTGPGHELASTRIFGYEGGDSKGRCYFAPGLVAGLYSLDVCALGRTCSILRDEIFPAHYHAEAAIFRIGAPN